MDKKNVLVGVANQSEITMSVEDIIDWEPEKVSFIGNTTYFRVDETFYSMETSDFKSIYGLKYK